jgi:inner membrane protein
MASLGHVAVGIAAARGYARRRPPWSSIAGWSVLSLLPDADVIGFAFGIAYADPWGHRGATHSLTVALLVGSAVGLVAHRFGRPLGRTALIASLVLASHGLLDTMTDGGLGCALLWPFDQTRYFAPWRPIPVAPIGLDFLSPAGFVIALTELVLFGPLLVYALRRPRTASPRIALSFFAVFWLASVWMIASSDPAREAIVGFVVREDTAYASGFSEKQFRGIGLGQSEREVRQLLGAPLAEGWIYAVDPDELYSAADGPAASIDNRCLSVNFENGLVVGTLDRPACSSLGVEKGISRDEVRRLLGPPPQSCWRYTWSPRGGRYRMRMVCFSGTTVQAVFRRWE